MELTLQIHIQPLVRSIKRYKLWSIQDGLQCIQFLYADKGETPRDLHARDGSHAIYSQVWIADVTNSKRPLLLIV